MIIDMWYGDKATDADDIDIFFSDCDCIYRGNIYRAGKCIGDFETPDSLEIADYFPQLDIKWR